MFKLIKQNVQISVLCGLVLLSGCALSASKLVNHQEIPLKSDLRPPLKLHAGDQTPIHLKLDESIIVEMTSNPSTGYRWDATQYTRERRCYLIKEINEPHSQTTNQALAGAPIQQRWTLRHDPEFPCLDEQRVTWTYRRAWEPLNHTDQQASVLLQGLTAQ